MLFWRLGLDMVCPYLAYESGDETHEFDHERPYCALAGEFVSPMLADVCNDRHDFDHRTHCDRYRTAAAAETSESRAEAVAESLD